MVVATALVPWVWLAYLIWLRASRESSLAERRRMRATAAHGLEMGICSYAAIEMSVRGPAIVDYSHFGYALAVYSDSLTYVVSWLFKSQISNIHQHVLSQVLRPCIPTAIIDCGHLKPQSDFALLSQRSGLTDGFQLNPLSASHALCYTCWLHLALDAHCHIIPLPLDLHHPHGYLHRRVQKPPDIWWLGVFIISPALLELEAGFPTSLEAKPTNLPCSRNTLT